jgi:thiamine transport system substrate-binding protein
MSFLSHLRIIVLSVFLLLVTSLVSMQEGEPVTLRLVTHDSFSVSEEVLKNFQEESGITVEIVRLGDTGTLVNQLVLSADNPLGDVVFGVDNTFLTRALNADLFIPYESEALDNIPDEFEIDSGYRVTPIDYGDICLNYDVAYFEENELEVPDSLEDLADPAYSGLLVVENPATSSPGLGFLLTTIEVFGEDGYLDYWRQLVENDVLIVDDWTTAYYGEFTVPSESGTRPMVVSYASSPPVEVYMVEPQPENAPTASIVADDTCFRQIEYAGILQGTGHEAEAQQFIDFLLSDAFQNDLPLQMFVFPVSETAELPEVFTEFAAIPEQPVELDDEGIEQLEENRETWIEAWTENVLR